jgi:hypothetical protein
MVTSKQGQTPIKSETKILARYLLAHANRTFRPAPTAITFSSVHSTHPSRSTVILSDLAFPVGPDQLLIPSFPQPVFRREEFPDRHDVGTRGEPSGPGQDQEVRQGRALSATSLREGSEVVSYSHRAEP